MDIFREIEDDSKRISELKELKPILGGTGISGSRNETKPAEEGTTPSTSPSTTPSTPASSATTIITTADSTTPSEAPSTVSEEQGTTIAATSPSHSSSPTVAVHSDKPTPMVAESFPPVQSESRFEDIDVVKASTDASVVVAQSQSPAATTTSEPVSSTASTPLALPSFDAFPSPPPSNGQAQPVVPKKLAQLPPATSPAPHPITARPRAPSSTRNPVVDLYRRRFHLPGGVTADRDPLQVTASPVRVRPQHSGRVPAARRPPPQGKPSVDEETDESPFDGSRQPASSQSQAHATTDDRKVQVSRGIKLGL